MPDRDIPMWGASYQNIPNLSEWLVLWKNKINKTPQANVAAGNLCTFPWSDQGTRVCSERHSLDDGGEHMHQASWRRLNSVCSLGGNWRVSEGAQDGPSDSSQCCRTLKRPARWGLIGTRPNSQSLRTQPNPCLTGANQVLLTLIIPSRGLYS